MSWRSELVEDAEKALASFAEDQFKSGVVAQVKSTITTLVETNAPSTEAAAIMLVNNNIADIIATAEKAVPAPFNAILSASSPMFTPWVEGIADGLVGEVFAKVVSQVAGTVAGQSLEADTDPNAPAG
jgi:hypothetical protein